MDLTKALAISARGMDVQGTDLRAIAEQIVQQDSTETPPPDAVITGVVDPTLGVETLRLQPADPDVEQDAFTRVEASCSLGDGLPDSFPGSSPFGGLPMLADATPPLLLDGAGAISRGERQPHPGTNLLVMQLARSTLTRAIDMLK
ncbi:MAG: hypothetical protein JO209_04340 [Acidisphaera sp.]|nr:hypothetical protein [Acidisphaera sp.]